MKANAKIKDLLIRSLDQELTVAEARELAAALENSPELQAEKAQLLAMRVLLGQLRMEANPDFAEGVMTRINELEDQSISPVVLSIFPKVAAACLLVFVISLLGIYFSTGTLSVDAIIGVQDLSPEDASLYLGYR